MKKKTNASIFLLIFIFFFSGLAAQQRVDTAFHVKIDKPTFSIGKGPVVMIDQAHSNMHDINEKGVHGARYIPFADMLRRDGYVVKPSRVLFDRDSLKNCNILVVSNAYYQWIDSSESFETWAFEDREIKELRKWVEEGGSLLLITDKRPFPRCVEALASEFGIITHNGYAFDSRLRGQGGYIFKSTDGSLKPHPILQGPAGKIDSVYTGVGSAFWAPEFEPLLVFGKTVRSRMPKVALEFPPGTPSILVEGWQQGAVRQLGKGRVAMFGEAGMFTAQIVGGAPMGLNESYSGQNPHFILNLMYWLSENSGFSK